MDKRILVIDDTKNIRMMISKCLSSEGYIIDSADNGFDGIEIFKKENIDVVILDIRMPKLSGTEVLKAIKDINDKVPVIMITAFPTVKNAVECIKFGAVDYLRKPFTPDKIKTVVQSILDRKAMTPMDAVSYEKSIEYAKKCINDREFDEAVNYLKKAISLNIEGAEPFNLIGTIFELKEDFINAEKYYRIALQLDPGYEGAIENLNRIECKKVQ